MLEWAAPMTVVLALVSSVLFLGRVMRGEPIGVSAHWGGLGGGTSGWRFSPALVLLLSALFFWIGAGAFALYVNEAARSDAAASAARTAAQASASAQRELAIFEREDRRRNEDRAERDQRAREQLTAASLKPAPSSAPAQASAPRPAGRPPVPPPVPSS